MPRRLLPALIFHLIASSAMAQSDGEKAQAAFQAAKEAYERGEFRVSVEKLREAFKYYPDPAIKVSIARRLLDLDEPEEALAELKSIETPNRRLQKTVAAEIAKVEDLLALPVPVVLETDPPGAMFKLSNEEAQRGPIRRSMQRGKFQLIVTLEGHRALSEVVVVKGTRTLQRTFKLEKILAKLRIEVTGVDSERKEEGEPLVTLDGKPVALDATLEVAPGRYVVTCGYAKGAPPTSLRVNVPEGRDALIRCALPGPLVTPIAWRKPVGWSSVGGGAAALSAGIGILISYAADQSEYPEPQYSISGSSKPVAGGVVTGLGAALVGLGTYFLLTE